MQPDVVGAADARDGRHGIDARRARRADSRHAGEREMAARDVCRNRLLEGVRAHAKLGIDRNLDHVVQSDADRQRALVDGRVRMLRAVDAEHWEVGAPRHAPRANREGRFGLARCGEGEHRRDGRRVVDEPEPSRTESEELAEPVHRELLELRRRRGCLPQHRVDVERRGEQLGKNARDRRGDGEVGEEARVVPVRDAGEDLRLEIAENPLE